MRKISLSDDFQCQPGGSIGEIPGAAPFDAQRKDAWNDRGVRKDLLRRNVGAARMLESQASQPVHRHPP